VTVLFCDLTNSTPLAEQLGPEAMHGVLNRFFERALAEVHPYEGTINQFLGDGFMALFGAPVAHEDHARRAALAALGIRRALSDARSDLGLPKSAELTVRMGLNTGPVVVGKIGDNLRMDYTAVGDTTNLAARLQQHAALGQILISEATSRLVKGYVRFEALAPFQVKGKAEPAIAFKVVGLGTRRSRLDAQEDRVLSEFVGRNRELGALWDVLAEVEAGHGQVVGIVGEPGVGKSRLLYEFRRSVDGRPVTYLEGRCLSFGSAIPYLPHRKGATPPKAHGAQRPPANDGSAAPPPASTTAAGLPERMASRTVNTEPRDGPQRNATTPADACASRRERPSNAARPALEAATTRPPRATKAPSAPPGAAEWAPGRNTTEPRHASAPAATTASSAN